MSSFKKRNKPNINSKYMQGYYKLANIGKYIGDPTQIIYRSSLEFKFCKYCDFTPEVVKWISEPEELKIAYWDLVEMKTRNYYPDYFMHIKTRLGETIKYIVEVKPEAKLKKPVFKGRQTIRKLERHNIAMKEYLNIYAKKKAAENFAEQLGYKYIIVTEKFIGPQIINTNDLRNKK